MGKLKAVFFGTPDFSVPALEMLDQHPDIEIVGVVTMPDRPSGRGHQLRSPEVAVYAKEKKLPLYQTSNINKEEEVLSELNGKGVDVFIVLAFAQFLGSKLLKMPRLGCFNIHTSLLPKYRGAAPIQYALLNGDKETGVSIQRMVKKMDAGDIAWSHPVQVSDTETGGQLYTRLKFQAALSLNDFLEALQNDKIKFTAQDESQVSFAPTLSKKDGFLNFQSSSHAKIKNQIRALSPWPGTHCDLNGKRLKVYAIEKVSEIKLAPGQTMVDGNRLLVGCLDAVLRLSDIQIEGKKRCSDTALLNGFKSGGAKLQVKELILNQEK